MFSFSSFAVFATVALSAVTAAIPLGHEAVDIRAVQDDVAPAAAPSLPTDSILPVGAPAGLIDILTATHAKLVPVAETLSES